MFMVKDVWKYGVYKISSADICHKRMNAYICMVQKKEAMYDVEYLMTLHKKKIVLC